MPFIAIAVFVSVLLGGGAVAATQTETGHAALESVTSFWAGADVNAEADTEGSFDLSTDGSAFGETRLAEDHDEGVTDPNTVGGDAYVGTDVELEVNVDGSLEVR